MKRLITSSKKDLDYISLKDSDWYRFITRVENKTGMKVVDGKWDKEREYLTLEDEKGQRYEAEIDKVTYYKFDGKNLSYLYF